MKALPGPPPITAEIPSHIPLERIIAHDYRRVSSAEEQDPFEVMTALGQASRLSFLPAKFTRPNAWLPTRAEDVRWILSNPDLFSSRGFTGIGQMLRDPVEMIPVEIDPPDHAKFRAVINPLFSPARMKALEPALRAHVDTLIVPHIKAGGCEFMESFASKFPVFVFLEMMGLPVSDAALLNEWEHLLTHSHNPADRAAAVQNIYDYLFRIAQDRRRSPRDDIITHIVTAKVDDRLLTDAEVMGLCILLFIGGLDTVASSLGLHFRHLSQNPAQQADLRSRPECIPDAVEELLRRYGIVTMFRNVTQEVELDGVTMMPGDRIAIATHLINLDERQFAAPLDVQLSRSPNRHSTFSFGIHRCVGSHLARRELVIAMEQWLRNVPPFHVRDDAYVPINARGLVRVDELNLAW
jgi:cytochrome P450